jgi:hypothetical protein
MPQLNSVFPGLTFLGLININATMLTNGISLIDAFPQWAIRNTTVSTIIFCTHENNSAGGVIYIGDLTMTSSPSTTASLSLLGPNVIDQSMADPTGKNTIALGNVKINASVANQAVRVSVLIG